jgi:hypothetical protein
MSETIHVSMDLAGMTVPVGVTYVMSRGNHTSSTFHYDAGYLGGFNRSSQHLDTEVLDGQKAAGCGSCAASEDAFAGQVGFPAAG